MLNGYRLEQLLLKPHSTVDEVLEDMNLSLFSEDPEDTPDKPTEPATTDKTKEEVTKETSDKTAPEPATTDKTKEEVTKETSDKTAPESDKITPNNPDTLEEPAKADIETPEELPPESPKTTENHENTELVKVKAKLLANLEQLSQLQELLDRSINKFNKPQLIKLRYMVQKVLSATLDSYKLHVDDLQFLKTINSKLGEFIDQATKDTQEILQAIENNETPSNIGGGFDEKWLKSLAAQTRFI